MVKTIIICVTILIGSGLFIYFSPYQTFMRDCIYDDFLGGDLSNEYCTWLYNEFKKVEPNSWLYTLKCDL